MLADCKHFIVLFEVTPLAESGCGEELRRDEKVGNDLLEESIQGKSRLPGKVKKSFQRCGGNFEMSPFCLVVCKGQLPRCTQEARSCRV